jgi:hypothetical protein
MDEWDPKEILDEAKPAEAVEYDEKIKNNKENGEHNEDNGENNDAIIENEEEVLENEENNNNDNIDDNESKGNEYDEQLFDFDVAAQTQTTRSGRTARAPDQLLYMQCNLLTQGYITTEYSNETAMVVAKTINHYNWMLTKTNLHNKYALFETFSLKKGLEEFGDKGYDAAFNKIWQLHERAVFKPVNVSELIALEQKREMESLIFLVEKKDGIIKARACSKGSTQREYINKDDYASPSVATESILLTAAIKAKEGRDVMTSDNSNAFVQTNMEVDGKEKIMMKIWGPLVTMLTELDSDLYSKYVIEENNNKNFVCTITQSIVWYAISIITILREIWKRSW